MKKLLVLALVLSMATVANATLQISINGEMTASEATITLVPSGEVVLDIWTDALISAPPGTGEWAGWALVADIAKSSISGGASQFPTEPGIMIVDDAVGNLGIPAPAGTNGVGGMILITGVIPSVPAMAKIYDLINFHCLGPGDVTVTLFGTQDYVEMIYQDSVVIHQIPEPITLTLLGLGGLFLRRRK